MQAGRFTRGFLAPYSAVRYWMSRPRLWAYGIWPVLINMVLVAGVGYGGYHWALVPILNKLEKSEGFWGQVAYVAAVAGVGLVLVVAAIFLFVILATIVGAPFYDLMGERIEKDEFREMPGLRAEETGIWRGAVFSIREALQRLGVAVPIVGVGFLLGFVPVAGPFLTVGVSGGATVLFLVVDSWSYALDRRRVPLRGKFRYVREHYSTALGLGLGLLVLYLIPCAWFFGPPLAAIAGTRLFCALAEEGDVRRDAGG